MFEKRGHIGGNMYDEYDGASMLFGKIVSWVRAAAPGIFVMLKEKTVHGA